MPWPAERHPATLRQLPHLAKLHVASLGVEQHVYVAYHEPPSRCRVWLLLLPVLTLLLHACALKGDQLGHVVFKCQLLKHDDLLRHGSQRFVFPEHGQAIAAVASALCKKAFVAMSGKLLVKLAEMVHLLKAYHIWLIVQYFLDYHATTTAPLQSCRVNGSIQLVRMVASQTVGKHVVTHDTEAPTLHRRHWNLRRDAAREGRDDWCQHNATSARTNAIADAPCL